MKSSKIFAFIILCIGLTPQLTFAEPASNRDLIKKAGIESVVMQIPEAMASGVQQIEQQGVKVDDKFRTAWAKAVETSFRADRTLDAIDKSLQKLTPEEKRALIAYYDTPAGQRIRTLEENSVTPEAQAAMQAYAQKFMADPKKSERVALYNEIDEATNASAIGTELGMKIAHATAFGMANALRGAGSVDTVELEKQIEAQRPQMAQQMQQTMLLSSAYIYRELTIAEIKAYVKFLKTPATKKFTAIVLRTMTDQLATQARSFGSEFARNFKRKDV